LQRIYWISATKHFAQGIAEQPWSGWWKYAATNRHPKLVAVNRQIARFAIGRNVASAHISQRIGESQKLSGDGELRHLIAFAGQNIKRIGNRGNPAGNRDGRYGERICKLQDLTIFIHSVIGCIRD